MFGAHHLGDGYERFSYTISSNMQNVDLRSLADANGYGGGPVLATFTISPGVIVSSASTGSPALRTGSWPTGSVITLVNQGYVVGKGGAGGTGRSAGQSSAYGGQVGGDGGDAILLDFDLTVANSGTIGGGGGGGGGGGSSAGTFFSTRSAGSGSGGGGGAGYGLGGSPGNNDIPGAKPGYGVAGNAGSATAGGSGGPSVPYGEGNNSHCGYGGDGGGLGAAGQTGGSGYYMDLPSSNYYRLYQSTGLAGGSPGRAVRLNGRAVTWDPQGSVYGSVS